MIGKYHAEAEDLEAMEAAARSLAKEEDPAIRMSIQRQFIKSVGARQGQEKAARMLTKVWKMARSAEYAGAE